MKTIISVGTLVAAILSMGIFPVGVSLSSDDGAPGLEHCVGIARLDFQAQVLGYPYVQSGHVPDFWHLGYYGEFVQLPSEQPDAFFYWVDAYFPSLEPCVGPGADPAGTIGCSYFSAVAGNAGLEALGRNCRV